MCTITCVISVTAPSRIPAATVLLLRQSTTAVIRKIVSGIPSKASHCAHALWLNCHSGKRTDESLERPKRQAARTPAEMTTPDAKPAAFLAMSFGVRSPSLAACFASQALTPRGTECLKIAVRLPRAQNTAAQSLSTKSSSRSIALPQHRLSGGKCRTAASNSFEAILRAPDVNSSPHPELCAPLGPSYVLPRALARTADHSV